MKLKLLRKLLNLKKGDVIVSGDFIAIHERSDYSKVANKFRIYYNTVYSSIRDLFKINTIDCGIGYKEDCRIANDNEKQIIIDTLRLEVENNTDKAKDAIKILKEVFDVEVVLSIRTYQDLIDNEMDIKDYYIDTYSYITKHKGGFCDSNKNIASSEKVAKSILEMAMISQLMLYYRGEITDKEWQDININKYCIIRDNYEICTITYNKFYTFLAFHTQK